MMKPTRPPKGIQHEVLLSLTLIVAAALFFAGISFVQSAERQAVERFVREKRVLLDSLSQGTIDSIRRSLLTSEDVVRLGYLSLDGFADTDGLTRADYAMLRRTVMTSDAEMSLFYSSCLNLFSHAHTQVHLTQPVGVTPANGAFVVVFSLDAVRAENRNLLGLVAVYVLLFSTILTGYGFFLLQRRLIGPIRNLSEATLLISEGILVRHVDEDGPREIAEVGRNFNRMVDSLRKSTETAEGALASLSEKNRQLVATQEELIRAERLASVGHLAAGMAHEIGNPLGAMTGYLDLLKDEESTEERALLLDHLTAEIGRIDALLRDVLDYADSSRDVVEPTSVEDLINAALLLLSQQGGMRGITVHLGYMPDVKVLFAQNRFAQVVINLLVNARDAASGEVEVTIGGSIHENTVVLSITDSGPGIPNDVIPHIFDPFFTTKDPGKGRGLGLSVCDRILRDVGGSLGYGQDDCGSKGFIVVIPILGD